MRSFCLAWQICALGNEKRANLPCEARVCTADDQKPWASLRRRHFDVERNEARRRAGVRHRPSGGSSASQMAAQGQKWSGSDFNRVRREIRALIYIKSDIQCLYCFPGRRRSNNYKGRLPSRRHKNEHPCRHPMREIYRLLISRGNELQRKLPNGSRRNSDGRLSGRPGGRSFIGSPARAIPRGQGPFKVGGVWASSRTGRFRRSTTVPFARRRRHRRNRQIFFVPTPGVGAPGAEKHRQWRKKAENEPEKGAECLADRPSRSTRRRPAFLYFATPGLASPPRGELEKVSTLRTRTIPREQFDRNACPSNESE